MKYQSRHKKIKMKTNKYTDPDQQGYYGKFGGAYIPEMLHRNVEELRTKLPGDYE